MLEGPSLSPKLARFHCVEFVANRGRQVLELNPIARRRFELIRNAQQLADRLGRAVRTLRQNYLNGLVSRGRLELLHPERPTSPTQAYRAVKSRNP
jgi:hypothetical protein